MPIISTENVQVAGQTYKRVIKCDAAGRFSAELPSPVVDMLDQKSVLGTTKEEVLRRYQDAVSRYLTSTTKTEKVILCQVSGNLNATIGGKHYHDNDISFAPRLCIGFVAGVYEKRVLTSDVRGIARYTHLDSLIPGWCEGSKDLSYLDEHPYSEKLEKELAEFATALSVMFTEVRQKMDKAGPAMQKLVAAFPPPKVKPGTKVVSARPGKKVPTKKMPR